MWKRIDGQARARETRLQEVQPAFEAGPRNQSPRLFPWARLTRPACFVAFVQRLFEFEEIGKEREGWGRAGMKLPLKASRLGKGGGGRGVLVWSVDVPG